VNIQSGHVTPYNINLPTAELRVSTAPGAEVWVEGQRIGFGPQAVIQVPIGTRDVAVRDGSRGQKQQAVEVKYGETTQIALMPETAGDTAPGIPRLAPLSQAMPGKR
jgi:hypothetical protein